MKLYLVKGCPFAHRASIALLEKGITPEYVFFDRGKRPAELEAVGPHAKSPTLFDGDARVYDSGVVLEYVEDRFPEPHLLPAAPLARAEVRTFITRINEELMPLFGGVISEAVFKSPRDDAAVAAKIETFRNGLEAWDRKLEGRTFAVGDNVSLADVTLYTMFPALKATVGLEVPLERKNLRAWVERMAARPSTRVPA